MTSLHQKLQSQSKYQIIRGVLQALLRISALLIIDPVSAVPTVIVVDQVVQCDQRLARSLALHSSPYQIITMHEEGPENLQEGLQKA